jgi:hypothetical protein
MKNYIGTKKISAEPCTRGEHSISKGFPKVINGNAEDKGYKVIYEDGYESWSPKDTFEKSYRESGTIVDRLLIQTQDLAEKINKLNAFMATTDFVALCRIDKDLLYEQQRAMSVYVQILGKRLGRADTSFKHL